MDINYICKHQYFGTKWALTDEDQVIPVEILTIKKITEYFVNDETTIYLVMYKIGQHIRELDSLHFNGWEFFDTKKEAEEWREQWT